MSTASDAASQAGPKNIIFVVDDESVLLGLSVRHLRQLGYEVLTATSGHEALRLLESLGEAADQVTLLLTDVVMPIMGGKELAEQVSAKYPNIKVLFATGSDRQDLINNGRLTENSISIHKPFTIEELRDLLRAILDS